MAGHSKWKTIKHAKAATDKKRASLFTKLIREITVAAKTGGGDPAGNPRLRLAIENARDVSMPKDNIERAIKKGTGELEAETYNEVAYEGYGPGGVALIIDALTDNPTRTVAEVRHAFSRNNGSLGTPNSVAWMFDRKGQILLDAAGRDEDAVLEKALEAGAEDFRRDGDQFIVATSVSDFHAVQSGLEAAGLKPLEAELAMVPKNTVKVEGDAVGQLLKLVDALEDLDDVQKVWANFDIDEADLPDA